MVSNQYKKKWMVQSSLAREIIGMTPGERLPTIREYTETLGTSRGIVQTALNVLQEEGAIQLEKRGKKGTCLMALDRPSLFRLADLNFITGSMPAPLNRHLSGLATGVCRTMIDCPVPFTFAFVQGAGNRVDALLRTIYDFIIVSQASAEYHAALHPELEIIARLDGSLYAPPYVFCTRVPGAEGVENGMTLAVDPHCTDQYRLTQEACRGKAVRLVECSYITARSVFLAGEVDGVVYREEDWVDGMDIRALPLRIQPEETYLRPAVVVSRENYGIGKILLRYLTGASIAEGQREVLTGGREPQFY